MNSYKDNLRATKEETLDEQGLALEKDQTALKASSLTLYYAQGTELTSIEKQRQVATSSAQKSASRQQGIEANDLSTNLVTSSNEAASLLEQSVSSISTAASNIEIVVNAIGKLSGGVNNAANIAQASLNNTELSRDVQACARAINKVVKLAEGISQKSMETAAQTSQILSSANDAHQADSSVENLLKSLDKDYKESVSEAEANKSALEVARSTENKNKASFNDSLIQATATQKAYSFSNEKLNLNLIIEDVSDTGFTVCFDQLKEAFKPKEGYDNIVEAYYILLVKNEKKSAFGMINAENLVQNEGQFVKVTPLKNAPEEKVSLAIHLGDVKDSDGDPMKLGQEYTVFILSEYTKEYKQAINNFEDVLSASSAEFMMTHTLQSPDPEAIKLDVKTNTLSFSLTENESFKVAYRCMYLPCSSAGEDQPGFLFNRALAEAIDAGSYSIAEFTITKEGDQSSIIGKSAISASITDNFGNPLVKGKMYLPVILSVSNEVATELSKFTNSLSSFTSTAPFMYQPLESENH